SQKSWRLRSSATWLVASTPLSTATSLPPRTTSTPPGTSPSGCWDSAPFPPPAPHDDPSLDDPHRRRQATASHPDVGGWIGGSAQSAGVAGRILQQRRGGDRSGRVLLRDDPSGYRGAGGHPGTPGLRGGAGSLAP